MGVSLANLYHQILEYRKLKNSEIKQKLHPFLFYMHKSRCLNELIFCLGALIITFDLLIGHPAIADPYCWSNIQNMLYFSLCRCSFTLGILMTIVPVLFGHKNIFKNVVGSQLFRVCGKTTFIIALTHPIIISLLYNTQ